MESFTKYTIKLKEDLGNLEQYNDRIHLICNYIFRNVFGKFQDFILPLLSISINAKVFSEKES